MPYLNLCQFIGNLGRDAELRYTSAGKAIAQASMACTRRYPKGDEWADETLWIRLVVFGEMGERFAELVKGTRVYVQGRIQLNEWEGKDGTKHSSLELVVATYQNLTPRAEGEGGGPPARRSAPTGSRTTRGAPPQRAPRRTQEEPPADHLEDLPDLPF